MQDLPLEGGPVELAGILDVDRSAGGITPRRLPGWTRPQVPAAMDRTVRTPAGGRLGFATTSTTVELHVLVTHVRLAHVPPEPAVFDLVVDGELAGRQEVDEGDAVVLDLAAGTESVTPGTSATVRFEGLAPGDKDVELWLSHRGPVELRSLAVDDGAVVWHRAPRTGLRWTHYGSSISQCREADGPATTWPALVARRAGAELLNLGFGGQCHLDQFVARTIGEHPVDVVSLELGVNVVNADSMRERAFAPAAHGFLDTLREHHPAVPVLVVSPIVCPPVEDHPGPTSLGPSGRFVATPGCEELRGTCLTLGVVRDVLARVVAARRDAGDVHLHHLDGRELLGPKDVNHLVDDLHPGPDGYRLMADRFAAFAFGEDAPFGRR